MSYDHDLEHRILTVLASRADDPELEGQVFALKWEEAPAAFGLPSATTEEVEASWNILFDQLTEMRRRRLISVVLYMTRFTDLRLEYRGYAILRDHAEDHLRAENADLHKGQSQLSSELATLRREIAEVRAAQGGWAKPIAISVVLSVAAAVLIILGLQ